MDKDISNNLTLTANDTLPETQDPTYNIPLNNDLQQSQNIQYETQTHYNQPYPRFQYPNYRSSQYFPPPPQQPTNRDLQKTLNELLKKVEDQDTLIENR